MNRNDTTLAAAIWEAHRLLEQVPADDARLVEQLRSVLTAPEVFEALTHVTEECETGPI
jgi:hypothetical protein